jgi:hypothetical protein
MVATIAATPTNVSNFAAVPQKPNNPQFVGPKIHMIADTVELAAGDDSGDIIPMAWVHRSWAIHDVLVTCDAVNSGSDNDLGLYSEAGDGFDLTNLNAADTSGDHDVYGASHDLSSAIAVPTSIFGRDPALCAQQVWADAGAADEASAKEWYLLALTCNFEIAAADTVSWQVHYSMPGGA